MLKQPETELEKKIYQALLPIEDPELFIPIAELGLIYEIQADEKQKKAYITMTFTSMACPAGPQLKAQVYNACLYMEEIEEVEVEVVWNPPWNPRTMATEEAQMDLGIY